MSFRLFSKWIENHILPKNSLHFPIILAILVSSPLAAAPPTPTPAPPDRIKIIVPAPAKTRIKFQAYDGDPKKPETMAFQINTLDLRAPTAFPRLGDTILKWKVQSFEQKMGQHPNFGTQVDSSELTLVHTVTKETKVIILNRIAEITTK